MADILTRLWTQFCAHFNIQIEIREKWLELIKSEYQRPYYDLNYLIYKLQCYESCQQKLKEPQVVLGSLIFQSIYYLTSSADNLEKCLRKFEEFVTEAGLSETNFETTKKISDLIEISVTNCSNEFWEDGTFGNDDSHYFLDINFANLAQDWNEYKVFCDKTRNEYEFLNSDSYTTLRRKVLQSFLHIPNIYATSIFRNQFEEKARQNIQREIDELSKQ